MVHGVEVAGTVAPGFSPSAIPAAASFRAGWQSLLDSMGARQAESKENVSGLDGYKESGAVADRVMLFVEPVPAEALMNSSERAATLSADKSLRLSQGTEQGSGQSGAGPALSSLTVHEGAQPDAAAESLSGIRWRASSTKTSNKTEEKKPEAAGTKLAGSPRPVLSGNTAHDLAQSEGTPGVTISDAVQTPVPASVVNIPQNASTPVIASPSASSTVEQAQSKPADLPDALPAGPPSGFASSPRASHAMMPDGSSSLRSGDFSEAVNDDANMGTGKAEKDAEQEQTSAVESLRGNSDRTINNSFAPAFKATAPANGPDEALLSTAGATEGAASLEISALGRNQAQTGTLGHDPALPGSQSQPPIQEIASNTGEIPAQSVSRGVAKIPTETARGGKSSGEDKLRSVPTGGSVDLVQQVNRLVDGQPSAATADASGMTRDQAGALPAVSAAEASRVAPAGPDSREVFATLDTEGALGRPTWIQAGAQRAEAGFQDPVLGWVGVRANSGGGGVRAELVAGSADAALALSSHMAGLNVYLAESHTTVESLTLAALTGGSSGGGGDRSSGEGMQQGTEQQTGQGADTGSFSSPPTERDAPMEASPTAWREGGVQTATQGGGHISVMA